jgi:hypothetical protein
MKKIQIINQIYKEIYMNKLMLEILVHHVLVLFQLEYVMDLLDIKQRLNLKKEKKTSKIDFLPFRFFSITPY